MNTAATSPSGSTQGRRHQRVRRPGGAAGSDAEARCRGLSSVVMVVIGTLPRQLPYVVFAIQSTGTGTVLAITFLEKVIRRFGGLKCTSAVRESSCLVSRVRQ